MFSKSLWHSWGKTIGNHLSLKMSCYHCVWVVGSVRSKKQKLIGLWCVSPLPSVVGKKVAKQEDLKEMGDVSSGMSSSIMQLYLKQVLEAFFHTQSSVRHFALNVIALTLNQGLIHPVQVSEFCDSSTHGQQNELCDDTRMGTSGILYSPNKICVLNSCDKTFLGYFFLLPFVKNSLLALLRLSALMGLNISCLGFLGCLQLLRT